MAKKPKITFADQTVITALQPYVDELLDILGDVLGRTTLKEGFISDESRIWCYLESEETGETYERADPFRPGKMRKCIVVTYDTPQNKKALEDISNRLGFPVGLDDLVYEVAIKLRNGP